MVLYSDSEALLRCSGDEDRSTQSLRRGALSRALAAKNDLVVDLSELAFADASLMVDLAMVARRLRKSGLRMTLRGPQPQIERLIGFVGIDRLPSIAIDATAPA